MAGSVGINGACYIDLTAAGTAAVGTATLTLVSRRTDWTFSEDRPNIDTTCMLDPTQNGVPGLVAATGAINGNWDQAATAIHVLGTATLERAFIIIPDRANFPATLIGGKAFFAKKSAGGFNSPVKFDLSFWAGPSGIAWTP